MPRVQFAGLEVCTLSPSLLVLKQTTIFNVNFHFRAIFQKSLENSMILPAALSEIFLFLINWCLCVLRTLLLVALSLTWTVVGGRRFRPTSGHLEFTSMSIMIGAATIRTIGRRVEYVENPSELSVEERTESAVECTPVFCVLMDAAVLACTFPRPSLDVKYNQLYSEMRNVRACFFF